MSVINKIPVEAKHDAVELSVKASDQSKVQSKLIFNSVTFESAEKGVQPNFKCPACGGVWMPKLALSDDEKTETYDFNKLVSFLVPDHKSENGKVACTLQGQTVELFMAVHRDKNGICCCIQKSSEEGASGIPANWWLQT